MTRQEILAVAKPILFNAEMVKAILEGRKTVTRRVVKNGSRTPTGIGRDKFYTFVDTLNGKPFAGAGFYKDSDIFYVDGVGRTDAEYFKMSFKPGDLLYMRETAMIQSMKNYEKAVKLLFKADDNLEQFSVSDEFYDKLLHYPQNKWLSPYWFTKEAARIFLRVTDVRCERLQDCGNSQAKDEGFTCCTQFARLWDSTIKPADLDRYGWAANPWVWVYSFERVEAQP